MSLNECFLMPGNSGTMGHPFMVFFNNLYEITVQFHLFLKIQQLPKLSVSSKVRDYSLNSLIIMNDSIYLFTYSP